MPIVTSSHPQPRAITAPSERRTSAVIGYLRSVVLTQPVRCERGHAVFLDAHSAWLGDGPFGIGTMSTLRVSIRSLLGEALRLDAAGLILAHSHPSGHCRPSQGDIVATRRLAKVAGAMDLALIDHLIFTTHSVFSMRAGGLL